MCAIAVQFDLLQVCCVSEDRLILPWALSFRVFDYSWSFQFNIKFKVFFSLLMKNAFGILTKIVLTLQGTKEYGHFSDISSFL